MKSKTLAVGVASLLLGTVVTGARAEGAGDMKYGTRVVAQGFESSSGYSAYMCEGSGVWAKKAKYYTKTGDYRSDVDVFYSEAGNSERVYTIRPNGDVVKHGSTYVVAKLGYVGGTASVTVTVSDPSGIKRGSVTWTPVTGGFYNAQGASIGTYGRAADGDMRMLAFTFFYLAKEHGCLTSR